MTDPLPDIPPPEKPPKKRYRPEEPLPPYRYVQGGAHPNPVSGDGGHFQGRAFTAPDPLSEMAWMVNPLWLYGVDLFNHRFFWEAHEVWEPLWRGLDKAEPPGMYIQGLMQVAGGVLKAHAKDLDGVLAFWGQADTRLAQIAKVAPALWGTRTKRVHKDWAAWFKPAYAKRELPVLDRKLPILKLAM